MGNLQTGRKVLVPFPLAREWLVLKGYYLASCPGWPRHLKKTRAKQIRVLTGQRWGQGSRVFFWHIGACLAALSSSWSQNLGPAQ
jgi:hypothetical protein